MKMVIHLIENIAAFFFHLVYPFMLTIVEKADRAHFNTMRESLSSVKGMFHSVHLYWHIATC